MTDLFDPLPAENLAAPKPTTATVMVSSQTALRWLDRNVRNRPLSPITVAKYARDMSSGQWLFTADPIRFDIDGNLIDGQHRLAAIAECEDLALPMLVVRGLPAETQFKMDQGRRRSTHQQLAMKGVPNATNVAAAVRLHIAWQEGFLFRDNRQSGMISSPQIEGWLDDHPDELALFNRILTHIRASDAPPSVAGAAAMQFMQIDEAGCREFFHLLATGAGVEGHPIVTLDRRLARIRRDGLKISQRDYLAFFVMSWNAWRQGRTLTKFQRPRGGVWTEATFPVPR